MNARRAAALVAVSFALAMCQPRLGIVVHRHAGSGRTHVHVGEAGEHHHDVAVAADDHGHDHHLHTGMHPPRHDHAHDGPGHGGHHGRHRDHHDADDPDVAAIPRAAVVVGHHAYAGTAPLTDAEHHNELAALRIDPPPPPDDASLVTGSFAHAWHTHAGQPFHHAALPAPPLIAAPAAVARLVLRPPHHRGDVAPIPGRSRAPPSAQSS